MPMIVSASKFPPGSGTLNNIQLNITTVPSLTSHKVRHLDNVLHSWLQRDNGMCLCVCVWQWGVRGKDITVYGAVQHGMFTCESVASAQAFLASWERTEKWRHITHTSNSHALSWSHTHTYTLTSFPYSYGLFCLHPFYKACTVMEVWKQASPDLPVFQLCKTAHGFTTTACHAMLSWVGQKPQSHRYKAIRAGKHPFCYWNYWWNFLHLFVFIGGILCQPNSRNPTI